MAAPSSLDRDPALPIDPVASPRIAGHPHLPSGGCNSIASASPPQSTAGAASPASTTPDPAATCGMPDRPLQLLNSPPRASRGAGHDAPPSGPSPRARGGAGREAPRLRRVHFGLPVASSYPLG